MQGPAIQIVFDAADPNAVAGFWRQAIGYKIQDPPPGFATWQEFLDANGIEDTGEVSAIVDPEGIRPRIYIQRVPEPKTVKNRLHLDIAVPGAREASKEERSELLEAEAKRLVATGARRIEYRDGQYGDSILMRDPEGNEFCLH